MRFATITVDNFYTLRGNNSRIDTGSPDDAGRAQRQLGRDRLIVPVPVAFDAHPVVAQVTVVHVLRGSAHGNGARSRIAVGPTVRFLTGRGGREEIPYPQRLVGTRQRYTRHEMMISIVQLEND